MYFGLPRSRNNILLIYCCDCKERKLTMIPYTVHVEFHEEDNFATKVVVHHDFQYDPSFVAVFRSNDIIADNIAANEVAKNCFNAKAIYLMDIVEMKSVLWTDNSIHKSFTEKKED